MSKDRTKCPTPYKRPYWSRARAKRVVPLAEETLGHRMYCYFCLCGYWHLTSRHPNLRVGDKIRPKEPK